jgi:hypothetical protein
MLSILSRYGRELGKLKASIYLLIYYLLLAVFFHVQVVESKNACTVQSCVNV